MIEIKVDLKFKVSYNCIPYQNIFTIQKEVMI